VRFRGKRYPRKPRSSTEPILDCLTGCCDDGISARPRHEPRNRVSSASGA
jgi:hypothetical protein